jgi:hypothetical protein
LFNFFHQQTLRVKQEIFFGASKVCGLLFFLKMASAMLASPILLHFIHQQTLRIKQEIFFDASKVCQQRNRCKVA